MYPGREALTRGWYVSPIVTLTSNRYVDTNDAHSSGSGTNSEISAGAVGGYHWFWQHFNIRLGFGLTSATSSAFMVHYDDGSQASYSRHHFIQGLGDFDLGWAF